ncbi:MAG TPA: ABC transporter permease [Vicinamibacterales bacterium]|nr:ABC transporter permease [Vicinamibacterales bacterium]
MFQDIKYGVRMLVKSPGFAAVAILSLALGIGANTAIFSLVNLVLLRPLPVSDPSTLVTVSTTDARNPGNLPLSHLNYKDLRAQNAVFTDMAAVAFAGVNYSAGRESEQIPVQVVSSNYFSVLGTQPVMGRGFLPEEETRATPVAVVSHGFWERSLGSDPNAVGRTITLNRVPFTVVGVAPKGFDGTFLGGGPSAWVPMSMHLVVQPGFDWYDTRRGLFLFGIARLKPGVTIDRARANLHTIFSQLAQTYPTDNQGRSAAVVSLLDARLNPAGQGPNLVVWISTLLMVVVGIVLLIACANIANLMLARASKRRREVAIRLALGAKRTRLIRQLLTESLILAVIGGGAGLLVAYWTLSAIIGAKLPLPFPVDEAVTVDPRVLAFTAVLAIATGILFGLAPALQASKADVVPVLKNEIVPSAGGRRGLRGYLTLRQVLVVSQVMLSLISLVAAGLFLRSLQHAQQIDPGFITNGVLVMNVNLGREGYTPERGQVFYDEVVDRVKGLPGVVDAAVAQNAPLAGGILRSVFPEGADATTRDRILVQVNPVSLGYFDTMGIALLHGRDFTRADTPTSQKVVVINQTMAARFWPKQDAIGKRFKFFGDQDFTTVVGIAKDSKYNGVNEDPTPFIYEPLSQIYVPNAALHVRTAGDAASLAGAVRAQVRQIDPTLSLFNVRTLAEQVSQSLQPQRMLVVLLAVFGLLALLLASIGLYGVASYSVSQRTREIGVRMALGATSSNVMRLVLLHGLTLIGMGLALGLAVSLAGAGLLRALIAGIDPRDPLTFAVTALTLGAVALLATYIPARRATRIDPLLALRAE